MRIAVDAMGGDNAPAAVVKGCLDAVGRQDIEVILVGKREAIEAEITKAGLPELTGSISIVDARDVIENEDSPVKAVRSKPDSSMLRAIDLVKEGKADAALSAGNTGALMVGSLMHLGRIKGVERPAIVSLYPHLVPEGGYSILVDAGANAECKPAHLVSFAYMGSIYMKSVLDKAYPSVGLINIGVEESKGTSTLKETFKRLRESDLNFIGNVEARDVPKGECDVMVCDGFTGNIVLKMTEGVAWSALKIVKASMTEGVRAKIGAGLLADKLRDLKGRFNYASYGGAPILGVQGLVFKMHGSSDAYAVRMAVEKANQVSSADIVGEIRQAMEKING